MLRFVSLLLGMLICFEGYLCMSRTYVIMNTQTLC